MPKVAQPKILEKEIQSYFINLLRIHDIEHWRQSTTALVHTIGGKTFMRQNPNLGFPDVCGLTSKGRFWAAEIKTKGGRLTDSQKRWGERIEKSMGLYKVIWNFDDGVDFITVLRHN